MPTQENVDFLLMTRTMSIKPDWTFSKRIFTNVHEEIIQYVLLKGIPHLYFVATLREKQARRPPASKQKNKTHCVNMRREEKAVRLLSSLVNHRKHPDAYWVKEHDLMGLMPKSVKASCNSEKILMLSSAHRAWAQVLCAGIFIIHRVALRAHLFLSLWSKACHKRQRKI